MGTRRMSIVKSMQRAAGWAYGRCGFGRAGTGMRVLIYHAVGSPVEGDVQGLYSMGPGRFEEHVRYLGRHCCRQPCPLSSWESKRPSTGVAVTFDDGYVDVLTVAAPLLISSGVPFSVFIWTKAVSERRRGFLAPEQLRELQRLPGVTIGSHTVNHSRLTACDASTVDNELRASKAYLEDLLGTEVDSVSYPHGAVNRRVRDAAEEAGYRVGATSRFGLNEAGADPLLLYRTDMWACDDVRVLEQKVQGDWDWMRWFHRMAD